MISKIKGVNKKMAHIVETLVNHSCAAHFLTPYVGDAEYDRVILYKMDLYQSISILGEQFNPNYSLAFTSRRRSSSLT
jgi:hypothetical protein